MEKNTNMEEHNLSTIGASIFPNILPIIIQNYNGFPHTPLTGHLISIA